MTSVAVEQDRAVGRLGAARRSCAAASTCRAVRADDRVHLAGVGPRRLTSVERAQLSVVHGQVADLEQRGASPVACSSGRSLTARPAARPRQARFGERLGGGLRAQEDLADRGAREHRRPVAVADEPPAGQADQPVDGLGSARTTCSIQITAMPSARAPRTTRPARRPRGRSGRPPPRRAAADGARRERPGELQPLALQQAEPAGRPVRLGRQAGPLERRTAAA